MAPSAAPLFFPTSLTNISSNRHRPPSQSTRTEGWTEVWGTHNDSPRTSSVLKECCDYIVDKATTEEKSIGDDDCQRMKLTQYRPAWLEQIILRICRIPHIVQNSSYSAAESTGSLPNLLDTRCGHDGITSMASEAKNSDSSELTMALIRLNKPVLIGRNHPGGFGSCLYNKQFGQSPQSFLPTGSHIVDYLRYSRIDVSNQILFDHHDMLPYVALIEEKLTYVLLALRYANDPAWEMVYRPQCTRASLDPRGERLTQKSPKLGFFPFWTWYQTYSERALVLQNLLPSSCSMHPGTHNGLALELFRYNDYRHTNNDKVGSSNVSRDTTHQHHPFSSHIPSYAGVGGGDSGKVNVYRAMEFADAYYSTLENKLESSLTPYFFESEKPSYIDAVLFAHLAEAVCDLHLVLVLAKHTRLVQYFQRMYDTYFGIEYIQSFESDSGGNTDWIKQNNVENACNAFNHIPESIPSVKTLSPEQVSNMSHAIELMQELAVHCHQMDEALKDAAKSRLESGDSVVLENYHRPMAPSLYKWCVGFWEGDGKKPIDEKEHPTKDSDEPESDGPENDEKSEWKEQMKNAQRDARSSDETWVMGVVLAVFVSILVSASTSKR